MYEYSTPPLKHIHENIIISFHLTWNLSLFIFVFLQFHLLWWHLEARFLALPLLSCCPCWPDAPNTFRSSKPALSLWWDTWLTWQQICSLSLLYFRKSLSNNVTHTENLKICTNTTSVLQEFRLNTLCFKQFI